MSSRLGIVIWRIYTWGNVLLENLIGLWPIPDPGSSATILYFSKTRIEPLRAPCSATGTGWGWKEGHTTELCTWRLLPEAQPLNLLCTSFDRKGSPFMLYWYPFHAPSKNTASLLTIVNATSFHINKTPNQEDLLSFSQPKMCLLLSRLLSPCTDRNDGYPSPFRMSLPFLMPEAWKGTTYPSRAKCERNPRISEYLFNPAMSQK